MKTYRHDYTLAAQSNLLIYLAQHELSKGDADGAKLLLNQAREALTEYLSKDNMIEDDDVAGGWVKQSDVENMGII